MFPNVSQDAVEPHHITRADERNFTRGYEDRYRSPYLLGHSSEIVQHVCIVHRM